MTRRKIRVLFYGVLRDVLRKKEIYLEIDEARKSIDDIIKILIDKFPSLKEKKFEVALNKELLRREDYKSREVKFDDEIALLPPFSGGLGVK